MPSDRKPISELVSRELVSGDGVVDLRGPLDGTPAGIGFLVAALHGGATSVTTVHPRAVGRTVDHFSALSAAQKSEPRSP